jgi:hypothetical protein
MAMQNTAVPALSKNFILSTSPLIEEYFGKNNGESSKGLSILKQKTKEKLVKLPKYHFTVREYKDSQGFNNAPIGVLAINQPI